MTTKTELNFMLEEANANIVALEDELGDYYKILEIARKNKAALKLLNKDNLGVAGVISIESQLLLLDAIFGEGEDDVLRKV